MIQKLKPARGRGSSSCNKPPADPGSGPSTANEGWIKPQNKNRTVQDILKFTKVSELPENFEPNRPDDMLCYFRAFTDEIMFEKMATETIRYAEQTRDTKSTERLDGSHKQ